ncbi:MAG: DJ-1/PfpI family protein [Bacteroidetes bacterium]|nr:DJ-1/PfpI family protein [Bacteroidota bacterium]MBU1114597.1 DJ-1/PfpI family protein [Bacteroidota bacterium]MBU1799635.1 DJ-1/PfpI family protein [Bacteroidota bacterium]
MEARFNYFKKTTSILAITFITFINLFSQNQVKVLIILPDQYGANYYLNIDNFERFGWDITIAGLTRTVKACPVYASPLGCPAVIPDLLISEVTGITQYDCVVVMSATSWTNTPPCNSLINNNGTMDLIKTAVDSGLVVAATCTGVRVLAAAGVINGKNVTGNPKYSNEYTAAGAKFVGKNHYPVIDGNIVTTAAGDYFNLQNCNAIAKAVDRQNKNKRIDNVEIGSKTLSLNDDVISRTYGGINSDGGRTICETKDGEFVIAGYTFSQGEGNADVLIIKTDAEGNQLWTKTFGGGGNDYANSIAECADGSFVIAGFTSSFGAGDEDVYLIKTDADGNKIWQKNYGGSGSEQANKIIETSIGNYLIAGYTESFGNGQDDVYLIYTDSNGDTLWTKTKGDDKSQFAKDIIETDDGKFLIVGSTGVFDSQGWGNRDVYLFEMDVAGNCNFTKNYGESSYQNWGNSICPADEGNYMIVGDADITSQNLYDVYAMKTMPGETMRWNKRFGEGTYYDYGASVLKRDDENYIVCGTTKSASTNNNIYVLGINGLGNVIKKQIVKDTKSEWASEGILTNDKKFVVITGHTNSSGTGAFDILFLKIPIGQILTSISKLENIEPKFELMQNYPNPFNPSTTIEFDLPKQSDVELAIFNLLGQKVTVLLNEKLNQGNHSIIFNAGNLTGGVYFYRITTNDFMNTKKFTLVK